MIEVRHLRKEFGKSAVLKDINCVINDGDVVSVIGPSGCGKSTFIRCLNLLDTPTSGEILFDGKNILDGSIAPEDVRKYAGMVFQNYNLYPQYTVLENIMVPQVDILGRTKQQAYDRAVENLKLVDMLASRYKYSSSLSGGQKQRVAIARALSMDSKVLLMDEPTAALDPVMVHEVQYIIKKLAELGHTMIIVTHEMRLAREVSNRVLFLKEGVVYEEGTPYEIFNNPKRVGTLDFVNCVNDKVFEFKAAEFEFLTGVTYIGEFAERNSLSREDKEHLISVYEETVAINIIPLLKGQGRIRVRLAYSAMHDKTALAVSYDATEENLYDSFNSISKKIIEHNIEEVGFMRPEEPEWKSKIVLLLK